MTLLGGCLVFAVVGLASALIFVTSHSSPILTRIEVVVENRSSAASKLAFSTDRGTIEVVDVATKTFIGLLPVTRLTPTDRSLTVALHQRGCAPMSRRLDVSGSSRRGVTQRVKIWIGAGCELSVSAAK